MYGSRLQTFSGFLLADAVEQRFPFLVGSHNKQAKRDEVLNQGLRLISEQGYNATGVKEIVEAASIPKGSFYTYFDSKEDLLLEALRQYSRLGEDHARAVLSDPQRSPLERIRQLFQQRISEHLSAQCRQGCFVTNVCHELAGIHEGIGRAVSEHQDTMQSLLANALAEARDRNEIQTNLQADELAELIENSWDGALTRSKARRSTEPLERFQKTLFEKIL